MSAKYRKGFASTFGESAANEDQEEEDDALEALAVGENNDNLSIITNVFPLNGHPFSAVNRQILPKLFDEAEELFDEFGFRKSESVEDSCADPTRDPPPIETSHARMQWLAHIQFTHEHVEDDDLCWKRVDIKRLRESAKFTELLHAGGLPHSLRPFLWPRLAGATTRRRESPCGYATICARSAQDLSQQSTVLPQIHKDLLRTLPNHYCFAKEERLGTLAMCRVLKAIAFMYPDLGYCQGMGVVTASLLLVCTEEDAFWMMCSLIESFLPPNYYSHSLLGVRADEKVVRHLMQVHMPELMELITRFELDSTLIVINWLITLLASVLRPRVLLRVWDHLFQSGATIIFRVIISILKMNEDRILEKFQSNHGGGGHVTMTDLFTAIQQLPGQVEDVELLLEFVQSFEYSITDHLIQELRKKYQSALMADNGIIYVADGVTNLPKQTVNRRKLSAHPKGIFHQFLHQSSAYENGYDNSDDPKTKNIRQTELVIDLKNAIAEICNHFSECTAEKHERTVCTQADYSPEQDLVDRQLFLKARREGRKRGRALLDFDCQEPDELGFRKNQLITIISEKDEHCWIGELDGRQGWFPAKFVEVIDERGKHYCERGDEAVNSRIVELTRGPLAVAFRRILFHGIRKSSRMSSFISHPWPFIESLSSSLVDQQHNNGNSRLTLCDTFKLDQDGKVLSPEELLYRAVQSVDTSHTLQNAQLDVKLRSLIAFGLNEQCLHLWFDIFCNSEGRDAIRKRYYHSWSFIRSPVAHQIKCELRLLSQFAFNLDVDSEVEMNTKNATNGSSFFKSFSRGASSQKLRTSASHNLIKSISTPHKSKIHAPSSTTSTTATDKQPLKEGVRDMLIKHHLFSWDL